MPTNGEKRGTWGSADGGAAPRPNDPCFMESLARGLAVIRAFGEGRSQLTGAEVAARTGLSRAAARRCLHTLAVLGYASASGGTYELTPAVMALGRAYLGPASIAATAQPVIERLADRLQEAAGVAVLDGEEVVFLARAAARRILSVELSVGSRLPAACSSSGRVMLAYAGEAARDRFLARVRLPRYTARTIVDRKQLAAELARVQEQGYSIVDQELEVGLRSMAVPVRQSDGGVAAALNVGVHAARVDVRTLQRGFVPALRSAAEEIAHGLQGGRTPR